MKKEQRNDFKQLISSLSQCFLKVGNPMLSGLLETYINGRYTEYELNEEVLNYLEEVFPLEDDPLRQTWWIQIPSKSGDQYQIGPIRSFTLEEKYNHRLNKQEYRIIMNKSDSNHTPYQNTVFVFDTKEERDKELKIINEKLAFHGNRILNRSK